ncbi:unnamed protein product [Rotaria socialis]|uniref:Saposin A-type domain-containing protein n=1 Tax=Rotaria socialis TaxID=392032 RepID=A0A820U627_9BILA|nr:unnamed protein product [Rotaria socialis]CAF3330563.1 unnamed protein product [Rotaria socialis]CAF3373271.1 unnamed protein product [Rotaria socialis]CAF3430660.1 unnamed protein product [Rotaria socialis]CAF3747611.1 unnamed protein product [Rotaria socialis]
MHSSFIFLTILIFCINDGLTINCSKSSAKWCRNKKIARVCGITEQCKNSVWKKQNQNGKVNFTLYYETLCPDCRQFMTTELWKAYQTISDIVNITIVPYGNARETYEPKTDLYQFICQHGPNECLGNLIHTCVLNYYPTIDQYMPFVYCTESTAGDVPTVAMQCAQQSKIDFNKIDACTKSKLGNQLQHIYATQTDSLQPPHKYVPWITVNDKHTEIMQHEAEKDLIKLICKSYKGSNPPAECKKHL